MNASAPVIVTALMGKSDQIWADGLRTELLRDGVDTDDEIQLLLQIEQAYAANARVLVAVDEMINQILRM